MMQISKIQNLKISGFTLAEVLITLVIIGVVAAITVPLMMNQYHEQEIITKLQNTYSILSQAVKLAEIHNGEIESWDIGANDSHDGAVKFYNYIAPEIKKLQNCGGNTGCFAENYKNLQGNTFPYSAASYSSLSRGILNNGVPCAFWSAGTGCNLNLSISNSGSLKRVCGIIRCDMNGDRKPNRAGYDFFDFVVTKDRVLPSGTKDHASIYQHACNHSSTFIQNGLNCTAWVLYKRNFNYKYKDISWN